jgi:hypothetical protein
MFLGPLAGEQMGLGAVFVTTGLITLAATLAAQFIVQQRYAVSLA